VNDDRAGWERCYQRAGRRLEVSRPSAGVRYVLERVEEVQGGGGRVVYRGFAHLPDQDLPLSVEVELPGGATHPSLSGGPEELAKAAAALVRSATKTAVATGTALPRKIVRWRG